MPNILLLCNATGNGLASAGHTKLQSELEHILTYARVARDVASYDNFLGGHAEQALVAGASLFYWHAWDHLKRPLLQGLPIADTINLSRIPRPADTLLCTPSSRVPEEKHHRLPPKYPILCALILFNN